MNSKAFLQPAISSRQKFRNNVLELLDTVSKLFWISHTKPPTKHF